ncbi:hypothetical protein CAEBREN_03220 [Caenorhabditis brenneri]|uniref:Uncharacterized protein n=1 Tax=Caenorhabditis brenneri TaxID=135651 RepID=G0MHA9_CAEBE|nr:hypothetical protein CAEBREN_03220 [Caenorhabditis brenneri]
MSKSPIKTPITFSSIVITHVKMFPPSIELTSS